MIKVNGTELFWQECIDADKELMDKFNYEMAKLGHLQIHAAIMQDSKSVNALAMQQNLVYSIAQELAYVKANS